MPDNDYRLPINVKPIHYDLTFKTSLTKKSFEGSGSILLKVLSPHLTSLTFNAHPSLELHSFSLSSSSLKTDSVHQIPDSAVKRDDKLERVTIEVEKALGLKEGDEVRLQLGWRAELGNSMTGYYLSTYQKKDTKEEDVYALTQFEPTDARKAFPCWDEPALKATFSLTMISASTSVNLSNMEVLEETSLDAAKTSSTVAGESQVLKTLKTEHLKTELKTEIKTELKTESTKKEEWKVTRFNKTPPMSTYLLTFASGPFEYKEDSYVSPLTGKTIPLRVYATSDIIHQVSYALEVTKNAVPLYEKMFDIPYALPKLDSLVASDFDAGAMEGWGLITGRTSVLLFDEKAGLAAKKRVATVQSHEIAHQWFGDLVTMEWWEQLWLNEAFATLCGEVLIPDKLYPEWNVRTSFISDHLFAALSLDAQRSSHAIEVPCPDANRINEIFDSISYSKGASVLRMLSTIVGEDVFVKGVSIYLKKKSFGNGNTRDLWDGISEASGQNIPKIMDPWTLKIGFPVLTVKEIEGGKIEVRQDRFLSTGDVKPEENETIWPVPLGFLTVSKNGKAEIDHKAFLSTRSTTIDLKGASLFKLNSGTTGVYRVAYSPEHLDLLGLEAAKKDSALTPEDRVGLVSDAHRLARAGYSSTDGALNFISHLKGEETEVVWSALSTFLADMSSAWWEQPESVTTAIDQLRLSLFGPLIDRLGFNPSPSDSPEIVELRSLAFLNAGVAGHQPVLDFSKTAFEKFSAGDEEAIHPDLRTSIFRFAVAHGGKSSYDKIKEVYSNPPNPAVKIACMGALTRSTEPALIEATLAMLTNKEAVKDQDFMYFLSGLSANVKSRRVLWTWFKANFDMVYTRFEGASLTLSRLIKFQSALSSQADYDDVKAFFATKDTSKFTMSLAQTLESIEASTRWVEKDKKAVEAWLEEKK
ncbi:putative AAP1-alanine/arginine aminopeptidase [Mrakia frigida]|uniref:M1 family metallopeptidase n=1 Tax=Mrakia frigida TaxID=29902 RepID=UPI003FCBEEE9